MINFWLVHEDLVSAVVAAGWIGGTTVGGVLCSSFMLATLFLKYDLVFVNIKFMGSSIYLDKKILRIYKAAFDFFFSFFCRADMQLSMPGMYTLTTESDQKSFFSLGQNPITAILANLCYSQNRNWTERGRNRAITAAREPLTLRHLSATFGVKVPTITGLLSAERFRP